MGVKNSVFGAHFARVLGVFDAGNACSDINGAARQADGVRPMITIRNLDAEVERGLRVRAATNGRSMEAEARAMLTAIVRYVPVAEMPGPGPAVPEKE
jgi:hypothetical protein